MLLLFYQLVLAIAAIVAAAVILVAVARFCRAKGGWRQRLRAMAGELIT